MIESPSNETLRLKLAIAELRQQLARDPLVARKVFVGGPMPKPEDIPQGLPPTPPMDPLAGDKTPTVVEWFRTYWPEEFERRYKDRKGVTVGAEVWTSRVRAARRESRASSRTR